MECTGRCIRLYIIKYFSPVLDEESFKEISKDIEKPDNKLSAPPVLNDVYIEKWIKSTSINVCHKVMT